MGWHLKPFDWQKLFGDKNGWFVLNAPILKFHTKKKRKNLSFLQQIWLLTLQVRYEYDCIFKGVNLRQSGFMVSIDSVKKWVLCVQCMKVHSFLRQIWPSKRLQLRYGGKKKDVWLHNLRRWIYFDPEWNGKASV